MFLCLMSSIKVKIASCPIRYSRYSNIYEFNDFDLKTIKENSQSIMIINYNLTSYLIENSMNIVLISRSSLKIIDIWRPRRLRYLNMFQII